MVFMGVASKLLALDDAQLLLCLHGVHGLGLALIHRNAALVRRNLLQLDARRIRVDVGLAGAGANSLPISMVLLAKLLERLRLHRRLLPRARQGRLLREEDLKLDLRERRLLEMGIAIAPILVQKVLTLTDRLL